MDYQLGSARNACDIKPIFCFIANHYSYVFVYTNHSELLFSK